MIFPSFRSLLFLFIAIGLSAEWFAQAQESQHLTGDRIADVKAFGAIGDGTTDDTDAIQRAVDSGRGRIVFPKGVYRLTRPVEAVLDRIGYLSIEGNGVARIEMAGAGPALRIIGTHQASADPGNFAANVWDNQRMPLIDAIAIVGKHDQAVGIEADGTMQITLTRLHLRSLLHGIHLVKNNRNVAIADCHIYHNRGVGIFYDDVNLHQSNITGCHISYCGGGGIVSIAGNVRNIQIAGCDIESNMSVDTPPTANVLIDCRGSHYGTAEVAITGCTIQHNNPSPDSANVRIIGNSNPTAKLPLIREGNVTIAGNVLSDVQVNLHLKECRGVAITGNTLWQGYKHNILFESCSSIVMGANNLDRNPRYDYGNTANANNSVVMRDCDDCTISGLHVTNVWRDPAAVTLENCRRINLSDCTILDCDNLGLLLKNVVNSRISGCIIRDDRKKTPGDGEHPKVTKTIRVEGGEGVLISNNFLDGPIESTGDAVIEVANTTGR
jgi:hypothetical protein